MNTKALTVITGALLILTLAGCGQTQVNVTANNTSTTNSMGNMVMTNTTQSGQPTGLSQAFQDELNGFTTIENDINKGNYSDATTLANNLHDEFHAAILPPLKAKKGETYAENVHSKYDELQDAIKAKDTAKIAQLIKVNRDNLHTAATILGVQLSK